MYTLFGALASPYSIKLRSVLRYRRLPFVWITGAATREALGHVRAPVIPVLQFPDGTYANDTTPLIYRLEEAHAERSIIPADPASAFIAHLLEDFADEWLTKAMFAYRWLFEADQKQMSEWLAFDNLMGGGLETSLAFAREFRARQEGRTPLVGCTHENFPLIEASTRAVLGVLEGEVTERFFLFGSRPSLAEFAILGQFSQLAMDPTPLAMMRADYPYAYRWLVHLDDLSGVEGEWDDAPSAAARELVRIAGETYAPFLAANTAALEAGADSLSITAMGHDYTQPPFKYQAKCLADLRARYAELDAPARERAAQWLGDGWLAVLG